MEQREARSSTAIAVISMVVAALSLMLSIVVVFNGSSRQAVFAESRQACVNSLVDHAGVIARLIRTGGVPPADLWGRQVEASARVQAMCFSTGVLSGKEFLKGWRRAQDSLADAWTGADTTHPGAKGELSADALLRQMWDATSDATDAAVEAEGPGIWPSGGETPVHLESYPTYEP